MIGIKNNVRSDLVKEAVVEYANWLLRVSEDCKYCAWEVGA